MRYVYLPAVFVSIVLLSGCTLPFGGGDQIGEGFVGGNNGLVASFVGSNPPARVFQGRNFNVILQLENQGEHNVEAGDVRVLFSNAQTFGLNDFVKYNENNIPKRIKAEVDYIPGGLDYIQFDNLNYSETAVLTEDSPISIAVDVCYPYQTTAVADVCVSREAESDICEPISDLEVQTSGGPILVSEIKQLASGQVSSGEVLVDLKLTFELAGEGDVYDSSADCSALSNEDKGALRVEKITLGNAEFEGEELLEICNMNKDNRFDLNQDDTAFVICIIPVQNVGNDFLERFTITVNYLHSQLLTKQISVMPVLDTMQKCTSSADCNTEIPDKVDWTMYCEQPGFCRNTIKDNLPCGLPAASKEETKSMTCINFCCINDETPNGVCNSVC